MQRYAASELFLEVVAALRRVTKFQEEKKDEAPDFLNMEKILTIKALVKLVSSCVIKISELREIFEKCFEKE